jgi:hypothetical protein
MGSEPITTEQQEVKRYARIITAAGAAGWIGKS